MRSRLVARRSQIESLGSREVLSVWTLDAVTTSKHASLKSHALTAPMVHTTCAHYLRAQAEYAGHTRTTCGQYAGAY
jgi:hypothetical protein